eukprot:793672-Pelagomonas_calceolata.AAC.6
MKKNKWPDNGRLCRYVDRASDVSRMCTTLRKALQAGTCQCIPAYPMMQQLSRSGMQHLMHQWTHESLLPPTS